MALRPSPELSARARRLGSVLEPVTGQVYFSPECHANYVALGFDPSGGDANGVALPDGPAYFTSRGSVMGQVPGEVVAAAFGVFNPEVVVPFVQLGWTRTDAATICAARDDGAIAQLRRILGDEPDGLARVNELLAPRRGAAAARGPPAVRRAALARDARLRARRDVADGRHAPRVPRRRAHQRVDDRRPRRHRDRPAQRAVLGSADAQLLAAPARGPTRSSTPRTSG